MPVLRSSYLFMTDVAAHVGVTTRTLYKWGRMGEFPCADAAYGKRPVWHQHTVDAWVKNPESRMHFVANGHVQGMGHGRARWPKEFIAEVHRRHAAGQSLKQIGDALGMHKQTVAKIVSKQRRVHA